MACIYPPKDTHPDSSWIIKNHQKCFTIMLLDINIYTSRNYQYSIILIHQLQHAHINMNTMDYQPMAREYSVWNVAVTGLQFWTADLKAHVLSSTIEEVYRAFFYSTSTHIPHQQSDKILFGHFVTTPNAAFERKLALEDEGYDSISENFNISTPLQRTSKLHHISASRMPLLIQFQLHHAVPENCASNLYAEDWHTAPLMMMTPQKMRFLPLTVHHKCSTMHMIHDHYLPSTPLMPLFTWKKKKMKKKRNSKQFHWIINIGLLKKFLTDHYVYRNIHYHMDYAPTHVHIWITKPPLISKPWI